MFQSQLLNIGNSASFPLNAPPGDPLFNNHPSIKTLNEKCTKVDFNFEHVSSDQVCKSIKSLKNKAPGHDKISAKIVKKSASVIAQPLASIFNTCVNTNTYPSACKMAEVTPGFKKGEDTDKSNYRPLSVLPAIGKLIEDLMLVQLVPINNLILHPLISAYRPGYSCQSVLLNLTSHISGALDKGKSAAAVATDLSSAFDCLPPSLMYHKLLAYGFSQNSAKLIHNYLIGRKQRVKIGNTVGDWQDLVKGTPQGSKLGPNLWNLFINDLMYYLPEDSVVNFADDNTLYAVENSPRTLCSKLNNNVKLAQLWYRENGMQPNPSKFQAIFFGNTPPGIIRADDLDIEVSSFIKLLGVFLDSKLKFDRHITNLCIKAGRHINIVKRVAKSLPVRVKLLLYKTYVSCHFNFCPLVWHFCDKSNTDKLENVQYSLIELYAMCIMITIAIMKRC